VTESVRIRGVRTVKATRLRIAVTAAIVVASLLILGYALAAFGGLRVVLERATFPFADAQFSEGPLFLQLQRMATGGQAYLPTDDVNSYVYGPVYLQVIDLFRRLSGGVPNIVSDRFITMLIGLLATVPTAFSALIIARRGFVRASNNAAITVTCVAAAAMTAAVMVRTMTFDNLHPDDLLFTLIATCLTLYYGISSGAMDPRYVWALAVLGVVSAFTELHSVALVPCLLFCLTATRAIKVRTLANTLALYIGAIVFLVAFIGPDMRAWAFLVPLARPSEFTQLRYNEVMALFTHWHRYAALLLLSVPAMIALLWRREGVRTLWVDALPVLALLATGGAGYFHRLGIKNSLFLIPLICVPYFAAMLGSLTTPQIVGRNRILQPGSALGLLLVVAMTFALSILPKQVPNAEVYTSMERAHSVALELCQRQEPIVVLALPDLFFSCTTATYALAASFEQLAAAFPVYYVGENVFDRRIDASYVVTVGSAPLPHPWVGDYALDNTVPALLGYDENYFPDPMQVYRHK
jgi:hypothetical protein